MRRKYGSLPSPERDGGFLSVVLLLSSTSSLFPEESELSGMNGDEDESGMEGDEDESEMEGDEVESGMEGDEGESEFDDDDESESGTDSDEDEDNGATADGDEDSADSEDDESESDGSNEEEENDGSGIKPPKICFFTVFSSCERFDALDRWTENVVTFRLSKVSTRSLCKGSRSPEGGAPRSEFSSAPPLLSFSGNRTCVTFILFRHFFSWIPVVELGTGIAGSVSFPLLAVPTSGCSFGPVVPSELLCPFIPASVSGAAGGVWSSLLSEPGTVESDTACLVLTAPAETFFSAGLLTGPKCDGPLSFGFPAIFSLVLFSALALLMRVLPPDIRGTLSLPSVLVPLRLGCRFESPIASGACVTCRGNTAPVLLANVTPGIARTVAGSLRLLLPSATSCTSYQRPASSCWMWAEFCPKGTVIS